MFPPLHICRCCSFHSEGSSFHFPSVNSYSSFLDRKSHLSGQSHQSLPLCGLLQQCPELPHHKTVIVTVQWCLCLPRGQLPHSGPSPKFPSLASAGLAAQKQARSPQPSAPGSQTPGQEPCSGEGKPLFWESGGQGIQEGWQEERASVWEERRI